MASAIYDTPVARSLFTTILDLPPCCLEFCPLYPDALVVGTYNLLKYGFDASLPGDSGQVRHGSLILYRMDEDCVL